MLTAGFNVAASIKMRKSHDKCLFVDVVGFRLQCGRIYKDAEIYRRDEGRWIVALELQCGRIYKDAEIHRRAPEWPAKQCSFNVAASIKMRKFLEARREGPRMTELQCGRIYKDAEI